MRMAPVLLCLLMRDQTTVAQVAPRAVPEAVARQNLIQIQEPIYPAIARAARLQGDAGISVVINVTGQIASEKAVSGPPMLRGAALDAVKKWQFTPFQADGAATEVTTTLTIPFHIDEPNTPQPTAEQQKSAQAWFPLSDNCRKSLKVQNTRDSLEYCKQALEMSLKAGDLTPSDQLAMLESHQSYGHALLAAGSFQEALAEENKAVDVAKARLKETDQEYAMPFYWRAMVEEALGQSDLASADLTIAENTHRKAIEHLPEAKVMYSQYLATILKQHAALLDRMGKSTEATKLREEASSLQ